MVRFFELRFTSKAPAVANASGLPPSPDRFTVVATGLLLLNANCAIWLPFALGS
jgi:hypothetical protein